MARRRLNRYVARLRVDAPVSGLVMLGLSSSGHDPKETNAVSGRCNALPPVVQASNMRAYRHGLCGGDIRHTSPRPWESEAK